MKIKEFLIARYGPISYKNKISLTNFNLIWGKNEEGKTLTIDALVKLLLSKNIRDFKHINRVDEKPEGYVIIDGDKGKEIKLPEKGDLSKFLGLTPSECYNIFIVRNSNLSIAQDVAQESEFYTNVMDRLTGLRTREISKLKGILREIGKITPTGIFRDIKDEKLKTRIESAKDLVERIKNLSKDIKEKRFDELEKESVELREEMNLIEQEIKNLEHARKREKYKKGKGALDKLKNSLEKIESLEVYNDGDEELWRDCERKIADYSQEKEEFLKALWDGEKELRGIKEKLSEEEREFEVLENRKEKLDKEIKPRVNNYRDENKKLVQQKEKDKFFTSVGIISTILLGISLVGLIFNPLRLFRILAVLFFIIAFASGILKFRLVRKKAQLKGEFENIKLALVGFGMDAEDVGKILFNIEKFDEEYNKKFENIQEIKMKKGSLEGKIKELKDKKIPDIKNKIKDAEDKIDGIKTRSKEGSLEEYIKKLKLKQKLERLIGEQKSILKSHFGEKGKNLEENIFNWEKEIEDLEEYKDKAKGIEYSETFASKLEGRKQSIEKKLENTKEEIKVFQEKMKKIERKANEIMRPEEPLYCETSVDLEAVKDKLQEFIDENESNKGNVLEVIKILEEIEAEEKEKVSKLFGMDSPITKYFSEITNGLYREVTFNQGTEKIEIKRRDGRILEAKKLSGGAYDQLYFSIRLALGEKLLKGRKGFFIMDDPFVKADPDRLHRQIEMLKKISELGWQVVYFSAKGEIRNTLEEDIQKGTINSVEIQDIFS